MPKKYLHCGNCWNVIGEIEESDESEEFDTMDCSWECKKCERLNLSSDGIYTRYNWKGDEHLFYARNKGEKFLIEKVKGGFIFYE